MKKQEKLKETTLNKVLDEANKSTKAAINQYKATNEAITNLLSPTKFLKLMNL